MSVSPLFVGAHRLLLKSVDSTNRYALELLSKNNPSEGTVVLAEEQYAGKGQFGSSWHTKAGENLTCSIILRPRQLALQKQFALSKLAALALCDACQVLGLEAVRIKWPNDIYHRGKKLAGILIENQVRKGGIEASVLGIGWNINQEDFAADCPRASSMALELGQKISREEALNLLCSCIEKRYLQLKSCQFERLDSDYLGRLLSYQEQRLFCEIAAERIFRARIAGIDNQGHLLLAEDGQNPKAFALKKVRWLWEEDKC